MGRRTIFKDLQSLFLTLPKADKEAFESMAKSRETSKSALLRKWIRREAARINGKEAA